MNLEPIRLRVTAAELVRRFGQWQEQAMLRPVYITHHGRDRLVLLSTNAYAAATSRTRGEIAAEGNGLGEPLLEQLAEGFLAFDRELNITAINPVAAAYLRLGRSELLGDKLFDRIDSMRRSLIHGHITRALQSGDIGAFDMPSTAYEGRWLHVRTFPYRDGAACLMRDITDEVVNRRLADAKAATLAALAAHGGIGRGKLSPRGTFIEIDTTLSELTGFDGDTLARARLTDILPLNRRVSAAREVEAVLTGGGARSFETALLLNSGAELPVRIALAELRGDYTNDGAVVVVSRRDRGE